MNTKPLVTLIAAGATLFAAGYWTANDRSPLVEQAAAQSDAATKAMPGDRFRDFCADPTGRRLGLMTKFVTVDLDLTAEQVALLEAVTGSVVEAATRPDGICNLSDWTIEGVDLPAAIASARSWMSAAQSTLDDVEPPLIAFYGSLNGVQRNRLSDWMSEHHRRHNG